MMCALPQIAPSQKQLRRILERSFDLFQNITEQEKDLIRTSFVLSYEGHDHAPRRASGEIYFMHVFRQYIEACLLMKRCRVFSHILLCLILLHDTVEDAEKGGSTPFIAKSQILLLINEEVAYLVMFLTKKKDKESRDAFLKRVTEADRVEVLIAKPFDGYDNMKTLSATKKETQKQKVGEIFTHYPYMLEKTLHLVDVNCDEGKMKNKQGWFKFVKAIHARLTAQARIEQDRINREHLTAQ